MHTLREHDTHTRSSGPVALDSPLVLSTRSEPKWKPVPPVPPVVQWCNLSAQRVHATRRATDGICRPPRCFRLGARRPLRISPSQQVGSCCVVDHLCSRLCCVRHVHSRFPTRWAVSLGVWSRVSGWMPWGRWDFVGWMVGDDGFPCLLKGIYRVNGTGQVS